MEEERGKNGRICSKGGEIRKRGRRKERILKWGKARI